MRKPPELWLLMTLVLWPGFSACYQEIDLGSSTVDESDFFPTADAGLDFEDATPLDAAMIADVRNTPPDLGPTLTAAQVASGENTTCVVDAEGAIWCWGLNSFGVLGTTAVTKTHVPQRIGDDNDWKEVNVGDDQACATRVDDSLWCWGQNREGQLARDPTTLQQSTEPLEIPIGAVTAFDTKNDHICALTTGQELFCWGDNLEAQVGQGTNEFSGDRFFALPKEVIEPGPWTDVSVGDAHTCGLKVDGSIWCWGRNTQFAASADETSQVLQPARQAMPPSGAWQEVESGVYHSCGRASDGEWLCWGANRSGQIRFPSSDPVAAITPIDRAEIDQISTNGFSACGLDSEGTAWCWGLNIDAHIVTVEQIHVVVEPTLVNESIGPFTHVSTGRFHVCGIDFESRIWCAGSNRSGQLGSEVAYEDISADWVVVPLP